MKGGDPSTVHNLPPMTAFRDERPDSPISEFALRVVVELPIGNSPSSALRR